MRVAPHHDGGTFGQAQIALAQLNALALGQLHQLRDCAMDEPGAGRMRDRLLLDSGIYRNPFEIFGVDRPGAVGHREALLQQRADLLLTQPLAPARERRAIKWQLVPEHHFPTEVLEIWVLHPSLAQRLVGEVVHMFENEQPGYQPRRQRRLPRSQPTYRTEPSPPQGPNGRRRHRLCHPASLLSRTPQNVAEAPKPPRPRAGRSQAGASPPRRCGRSWWPALPPPPASAAAGAVRSPTDRHWSPSSVAN